MKKIMMMFFLAFSSSLHALPGPLKRLSWYEIKHGAYLWIRPIPHIYKAAKKYPVSIALIGVGGAWLWRKDKIAAGIYFFIMYVLLKYNLDKDIRYNSTHEYFMRERSKWHKPRLNQESLDPLDNALFNPNSNHPDLNEYEQTLIEMSHLEEAGSSKLNFQKVTYTTPCAGCNRKRELPFECSCNASYCLNCASSLKANRCKCYKCNNEMIDLVDYFY